MVNWARVGQLTFVYTLCAFWSFVQLIRVAIRFAQKGWALFELKPRMSPPKSLTDGWNHNRIKLSEVSLHYVSAGSKDKPLMVMVHGFPEFWYTWRHQIKHFAKDYYVVAIDMRGYGDSDKPSGIRAYDIEKLVGDLKEIVPALGYKKCVLVAHDWGGAVAWQMAINFPEYIEKFIVCNCPHPQAFRKFFQGNLKQLLKSWYMFFFQCPFFPEFFMRLEDFVSFDMFFRKPPMGVRNPNGFTDEDLEAWKYTFQQPGRLTPPINYYRASLTRDPSKPSIFKAASGGKRPVVQPSTLIIWGTADAAIEQGSASLSAEFCRDCTVRFIEGASHWIQNDEPQLVNQYMEKFLAN